MSVRRRIIGIVVGVILLGFLYRVLTVYTVRSGECAARPVSQNVRREALPAQTRPLVVMTYNVSGHSVLLDGDHLAKIAAVINSQKPDIVGLEEVHRGTWQARFGDQAAELARMTGLHAFYGPSFRSLGGEFGNMLLTRGEIVKAEVHPLPSYGEPRSLIDAQVRIDGALLDVYVGHLTAWGKLNAESRGEQLACISQHVRGSLHRYILMGDFNAPPDAAEMQTFFRSGVGQSCGPNLGPTQKQMHQRIDYIIADPDWQAGTTRVVNAGPSDHWPVVAQLTWTRQPTQQGAR